MLDPQNQAMLDVFASQGLKPFEELTPAEQREIAKGFIPLQGPPEEVGDVETLTIPSKGGEIDIRLYKPATPGPHPIIIYLHGGGFVFGDLDLVDTVARAMTNRSGAAFVSVNYRKSPEHRYPTAAEDAYAALIWADANAAAHELDPTRIAVLGDSAGGGLATVVAQMARNRNGPKLVHQLVIYPLIDAAGFPVDDSNIYPSRQSKGDGYFLTSKATHWFWQQYLERPEQGREPYASPINGDLHGLPPATIVSAGYDPLLDEGEAYGTALEKAGVAVEYIRNPNQIHGFFWMGGAVDHTAGVINQIGDRLRRALATA